VLLAMSCDNDNDKDAFASEHYGGQ
jgi:hypothetical protein